MTQKLTILIDLDGTLVDTAPDLIRAHNYVMKKYGYDIKSSSDIRQLVGKGTNSLITKSVWGKAKEEFNKINDKELTKKMVKEFINYYGENIANESTLINGVKEFLQWAKDNKCSLAVCTNKQEHLAIDLLKKIKIYEYFEYVAGSNTFNYCKPDPRHLTSVIEILNGDLKKSIMIGDSETDSEAAKSANLPFVLLKNGYTDKKSNEIYHNYLVKDFIGIEKIFSNYIND